MAMTTNLLLAILGLSIKRSEAQHMIFALSLHAWRNTDEENMRLDAAKQALAQWGKFNRARQSAINNLSKEKINGTVIARA